MNNSRLKKKIGIIIKSAFGVFFLLFVGGVIIDLNREVFDDAPDGAGYFIGGIAALSLILGVVLLNSARKDYKHLKGSSNKYDLAEGSPFYQKYAAFCSLIDNVSFNGFGTKFLTLHNKQHDGSFSAIQWFVLGHFPIIPLYQVRLRFLDEKESGIPFVYSISRTKVEKYQKERLNYRLVRWTYATFFLLFIPLIILPIVLLIVNLGEIMKHFPGPNFWWLILGYFIWGIAMYVLWQFWNNRFFLRKEFYSKD